MRASCPSAAARFPQVPPPAAWAKAAVAANTAPVNPPVTRPLKELKGFKKLFLQPGECKKVTITLDRRSLAYYDLSAHAWDVARGVYRIFVGASSQDIRLQGIVVNLCPAQLSVFESKPVPVQRAD